MFIGVMTLAACSLLGELALRTTFPARQRPIVLGPYLVTGAYDHHALACGLETAPENQPEGFSLRADSMGWVRILCGKPVDKDQFWNHRHHEDWCCKVMPQIPGANASGI